VTGVQDAIKCWIEPWCDMGRSIKSQECLHCLVQPRWKTEMSQLTAFDAVAYIAREEATEKVLIARREDGSPEDRLG
jgi:hypothetical protein